MMPGLAPVLSLPGDRMFQAKEVAGGHQRPAIIHAYGGAKASMERSLASIAPEGWIPMAAAMLGTVDKPPMWASFGLRPVVGTILVPSTSGCYFPYFRIGRNCSCSRVGNIGMPPVSRTLLCPNGLLELMWNKDPMGLAPLPF